MDLTHLPFESLKVPLQVQQLVGGCAMSGNGLIDQASRPNDEVDGQVDKRNNSCGQAERIGHCGMKAEDEEDEEA